MKRLGHIRSRLSLRKKFALSLAALLSVGISTNNVDACDYCDQGDGGMVACDACSSQVPGSPNGPIFKTLDAFAGGVEKFLGFDKCGTACDAGCDGCDAGLMQELMAPAPATTQPHYHQPVMPSVPPEAYTEPVAPTRIQPQTPTPLPSTQPNGGGIFDSLNDPFGDDEVRAPRTRSVQPSSFQRSVGNAARPTTRTASSRTAHAHQHSAHQNTSRHHTAQHTSNSLKRAAARPTPSRTSQHAAHRPVHHHQHHVHHHAHNVQLNAAPAPKTQQPQSVRRQSMGQRHAWTPVNSYGQSTR